LIVAKIKIFDKYPYINRNLYIVINKWFVFLICIVASTKDNQLHVLLGKRIKELRKEAGYTSQETFAYDAEIPRALYGKYEKGSNITIDSLHRILKFHKITFKDFFKKGFENY
jgi:hypothetical protein